MITGFSFTLIWLLGTPLSTRAMEHDHSNATSSPPFGAMHPEPFNPVATLPPPSSSPDPPIHKRVTRGRVLRQSGLEGTEVSHGESDHSNSFPSTEIMDRWTVTPRPKRSPQEYNFRLPTGGDTLAGQLNRIGREMVTLAQEKKGMMGMPSVTSVGRLHGFVDEKTDPEDTSGHRGTKAVRRRRDASTTTMPTTTEEDVVASGQERAGETGIVIPGTFIGT
ncbi:hypothetical protein RvY_10590-4 [Ramazzottius varieornatus]|uniref:Uncharacterized protein n=1 Tax=Ramazzottius varieornatus TaxID=947166 RepID=A0A1D1VHR7_RAMVA|nr:hypothetical protein RvY_10590-4 [Ramazzottius varieornatus]